MKAFSSVARWGLVACVAVLGACAKKPDPAPSLSAYKAIDAKLAAKANPQAASPRVQTAQDAVNVAAPADRDTVVTGSIRSGFQFTTRQERLLEVAQQTDLQVKRREVILTFDDGPSPTVTPLILKALDEAGVKAVFFMVGQRATAHPKTTIAVAKAGHTIGTHTRSHADLTQMSITGAMAQIADGNKAIARILKPYGYSTAPFFRFPYLAQSSVLRTDVREAGYVIFGADIDSKDYWRDSSDVVLARTLKRLDAAGGGIVLFHDIHKRTALMLPAFLKALKVRGYRVVDAVPPAQLPPSLPSIFAGRSQALGGQNEEG